MYLIHFFDYAELHCTKNAADNSGASSSVTTGGLLASSTSCISITHKKVSYYNKILLKVKVWNIISYFFHIRACLKNHSRNLHAPLCGIFCLNSVAVARYGAFIRTKSPTNCDAHLAESLFQTRSRLFQTGFRVFSSHISSS